VKRRQITYIAEELAWIEAHKDWSRADLHRGFVALFMRPEVTADNIRALCCRKGWRAADGRRRNKGKSRIYSPDEIRWMRDNAHLSRKEVGPAFRAAFDRPDITDAQLVTWRKNNRVKTGRTGRFEKGAAPMNKGKKMPYNAKSAATQFKKGQRPINKQDVGYERIDRDGYVILCIAERNPWTGAPTRMYHKHRYLWEQLHGKVPKGHFLKCLDGNRTNTDPSNWECLPEAMKPRFSGRHTMAYDTAPAELKPTLMAIAKLEQKVRSVKLGAPSK
jgi:hypothetical protein